jgi:hypothetical protein
MTFWGTEFSLNLDFDQMEGVQNYIKKLFILLYDLLYNDKISSLCESKDKVVFILN